MWDAILSRVFVFPSPRSSAWPSALAPNLLQFLRFFTCVSWGIFPAQILLIVQTTAIRHLYLPVLTPNLYLTALAANLYLPTLAPNLYLPTLAPNFYLRALVNPEPGLAYTNLISQICIYWPCPTIFITMLWICIYLLIYSGSSGYSNISNSSNFLGLENTNISMPILVN